MLCIAAPPASEDALIYKLGVFKMIQTLRSHRLGIARSTAMPLRSLAYCRISLPVEAFETPSRLQPKAICGSKLLVLARGVESNLIRNVLPKSWAQTTLAVHTGCSRMCEHSSRVCTKILLMSGTHPDAAPTSKVSMRSMRPKHSAGVHRSTAWYAVSQGFAHAHVEGSRQEHTYSSKACQISLPYRGVGQFDVEIESEC